MKKTIMNLSIATLMLASAHASVSTQEPGPKGVWLSPNQRYAVAIVSCGQDLCGKIAWLKSPNDAQGQPRVDAANPDPALHTRPILGLTVLQGLHQVDDHTWEDGTLYNPDDGGQYGASLSVASDGTLHVRAYELAAIFGKTIVLTRVS